jgi:hypothetical protein
MSLGCIPLVTNVGGMPEIVNDSQNVINRNFTEISTRIEKIACEIDNQNFLFDSEIKKSISKFSFRQRKITILYNLSIQI